VARQDPRPAKLSFEFTKVLSPDYGRMQPTDGRTRQPGQGRRDRPDDDRLVDPLLGLLRHDNGPAPTPAAGPRGKIRVATRGRDHGSRPSWRRGKDFPTPRPIDFSGQQGRRQTGNLRLRGRYANPMAAGCSPPGVHAGAVPVGSRHKAILIPSRRSGRSGAEVRVSRQDMPKRSPTRRPGSRQARQDGRPGVQERSQVGSLNKGPPG